MPTRDFERIRKILLLVDGDSLEHFDSGWVWARGSEFFVESDKYQIVLLSQAEFLECTDISMASVVPDRLRITFAGHDYLDSIRDDGIWNKTKQAVAETGGSATLEIIKSLATGFLKKKIEQHTGITF